MLTHKRKTIFPSHSAVYKRIQEKQTAKYSSKLDKITAKIEGLKSRLDLDQEHKEIAKKLINDYKRQALFDDANHDQFTDLRVVTKRKAAKYADTLNEYLDNSDEEDTNYEAHLKFRKKALERELQEDEGRGQITKSRRMKENLDEEELFFKNLYNQNTRGTVDVRESQGRREGQGRLATLKQNKKKLTEQYLPYVQAMAETNIVKWRILG